MSIVCGTDFSETSARALTAAALLAARLQQPLHLVHTLELGADDGLDGPGHVLRGWAAERLQQEATRLRAITSPIEVHVKAGLPDDVLLEVASRTAATLIVVGPAGRRDGRSSLGGHADRIAQRSHVPVLVLRTVEPFEHWVRAAKPLRIVLGTDASASAEAALRWIQGLRAFGPCDVIAAHLYWPPEEFRRLGLSGVRSYLEPDPEVTRTLEREFFERLAALPEASTHLETGTLRYRSAPHIGRVAEHLADIAEEEAADLVVVGSHSRNALARLWEGSVSRGVLQCARGSAVCVPAPATPQVHSVPKFERVLVATDFSATGDAAIPLAYAAAPGATVHLVHVLKAALDPAEPNDVFPHLLGGQRAELATVARKALTAKIPRTAAAQGKKTQLHVLESNDVASAICQATERLGVDLLCLGTHGRSGVARTLLGSVAQEVLARSLRPVLLARRGLE